MSEKANYVPEPQTPAPPSYEHPAHAVPSAEQSTQRPRSTSDPSSEIQLQTLPPQNYANTPPPNEPPTQHDPSNHSPQMYPPQPQLQPAVQQPSQYPTAVPLHALQRSPQVVDCPVCGQREMTRTEGVTGKTTHGWAGVLCFCACLGCIPYFAAAFKDMNHMCGRCGHVLATYHNSGHVEVHKEQTPKDQAIQ
ncbi:LITAF-like zinc ribbon domain-containing protein [Aspergillus spectabilis]